MDKKLDAFGLRPSDLEIGDIVFIRISNFLYRRVAEATQSWTSHVGVLYEREGDNWVVAESRVPLSGYCRLTRFLERSENERFAIMRLQSGLSDTQKEQLQKACEQRKGIFYDMGFNLDSSRQFCSKYVYEIYREVTGLEIGKVETFRELLQKDPAHPLLFWQLWFLGRIPWQRLTISPASQLSANDRLFPVACSS